MLQINKSKLIFYNIKRKFREGKIKKVEDIENDI